jgi:hypothetical protein
MLLLNECLLLLFISLSTQSGNFWIHFLSTQGLTSCSKFSFVAYRANLLKQKNLNSHKFLTEISDIRRKIKCLMSTTEVYSGYVSSTLIFV